MNPYVLYKHFQYNSLNFIGTSVYICNIFIVIGHSTADYSTVH